MVPRPLLLAGVLATCCTLLHGATQWRPIEPADTAARPPENEPAANGLTLLREIFVDASKLEGTDFEYYFRAKVFTSAGVEALNQTQIPFEREAAPRDLAARVIKPDGRTVEVSPNAFYTREVVRAGGESASVKAFAFAALEPGDIAEYRYRVHDRETIFGLRCYLDDVFPAALVRIRIGMISYKGLCLQTAWSNNASFQTLPSSKIKEHVFEAKGLPSVISEPCSPPDDLVKPWFFFYYTFLEGSAQDYWGHIGEEMQALTETYLAPKKLLKERAAALLVGSVGEEDSIRRLYEFCRTKIKNLSYADSGYTPDQIDKLKENRTTVDILTNGYGTCAEINLLFGALLRASGHDCHLAYCGDRSLSFFNQNLKTRSALPHLLIAIDANEWKFYDPGARYLPPGSLNWKHESTTALVAAAKSLSGNPSMKRDSTPGRGTGNSKWQFLETPRSPAQNSTTRRTANFTLTKDGTLEGDIAITKTGQDSFLARHRYGPLSTSERTDAITQDLVGRLGQVEVSNLTLDLAADLTRPVTLTCHVKVRDYATNAGERLLLPFTFFQKGVPEIFPSTERKFGIYFPYFLQESDKVSITLPEGYELETPGLIQEFGDGDKLHYSPCLSIEEQGRRIIYERTFIQRLFHLPANNYPVLQELFHQVAEQDERLFSLCPTAAPPPASGEPASIAP